MFASTKDNNMMLHQMSAKVAFLFEHLANTNVLVLPRLFEDDDDYGW